MLVLSRQRDEVIRIGDDIQVTIVDIRGDKVRIGITAPRDVSVHRDEVYRAIHRGQPPRKPAPAAQPLVPRAAFCAHELRQLEGDRWHCKLCLRTGTMIDGMVHWDDPIAAGP